jgi:hypothetical protein
MHAGATCAPCATWMPRICRCCTTSGQSASRYAHAHAPEHLFCFHAPHVLCDHTCSSALHLKHCFPQALQPLLRTFPRLLLYMCSLQSHMNVPFTWMLSKASTMREQCATWRLPPLQAHGASRCACRQCWSATALATTSCACSCTTRPHVRTCCLMWAVFEPVCAARHAINGVEQRETCDCDALSLLQRITFCKGARTIWCKICSLLHETRGMSIGNI